MNTLVVYFSKFGNTQKIAEAIAKTFESAGGVRLLPSDRLEKTDLEKCDLVVMGSPTHKMNLPKEVRPVFERLPKAKITEVKSLTPSAWAKARRHAGRPSA